MRIINYIYHLEKNLEREWERERDLPLMIIMLPLKVADYSVNKQQSISLGFGTEPSIVRKEVVENQTNFLIYKYCNHFTSKTTSRIL